ncbi:MAG TPA: hypothetical protein VK395_26845 [Gemmataceae bacterium]|nr:hypothetical protein [Gemmataceae bacterium]
MKDADNLLATPLAKAIAALCVRNTFLEDLHAGTTPSSKGGDYSDVKVVTPYGEIPWPQVSRISDKEMKRLMKEIVNALHTFLCRQDDAAFIQAFIRLGNSYTARWDEPELLQDFVAPANASRTKPAT